MKKKFLDYAIATIHAHNPTYNETKLAELRYGLEATYLTVTKTIIIFFIALLLGIFKEMIIMLLIFNILRTTGFGLHATKSWICLLFSTFVFIGFPYIATIFNMPMIFKYLLAIASTVLMFIYAPADTKKRPLIDKRKRNKYKIITTATCLMLNIVAICVQNLTLSNLIIFGIWTEIFLILPSSYRLFNLSYNNYKTYKPIHG